MREQNKFATPPPVLYSVLLSKKYYKSSRGDTQQAFSSLACALSEAEGIG